MDADSRFALPLKNKFYEQKDKCFPEKDKLLPKNCRTSIFIHR
jgi:hypothetical protein